MHGVDNRLVSVKEGVAGGSSQCEVSVTSITIVISIVFFEDTLAYKKSNTLTFAHKMQTEIR